ncbi:MCP four helix bundle domain-containing protein [Candidatus Methylospira mobilis]|uniref:MCP four helix bundle domain-containing protein n=1 Tax=Candidatus Methylospira mobilis TaxID=1808979 RepID=UPI0028EA90E2|nr:MCP four helix bundle domain-containing protein [Candidatus Methylospira mobilis]WNV03765.1 MCP four helix bundle domain-containing protein [Candidatus Methylospira mobilis]
MGFFGFNQYQTSRVYKEANYALSNSLPSVVVLDAALLEITKLQLIVCQRVAQSGSGGMSVVMSMITESRTKIDGYLNDYEPLVFNEEDRRLLQEDYQALAEYDDMSGKVLALSNENKSDQAYKLLMSNQRILNEIESLFHKHRDFNINLGKKSAEDGVSMKNNAALLSLLVAAVVLTIPVVVVVLTFPGT